MALPTINLLFPTGIADDGQDHLNDMDDLLNIIIATTILDWAAAHKVQHS